ncbi:MAG: hypothetical protein DCC55_22780 [Chloroflexi bacterium]|nr:MAG: hypothetical protein DCC55_22780 [Chloroflexota bacterium]
MRWWTPGASPCATIWIARPWPPPFPVVRRMSRLNRRSRGRITLHRICWLCPDQVLALPVNSEGLTSPGDKKMTDIAFFARLSSADTDEMIEILTRASYREEQLLRAYLGPDRYRRLRSLALRKRSIQREAGEQAEGNVLVVPGLLANELSSECAGVREQIWLNARALTGGYLSRLRLAENGLADANPDYPVRVTGLLKRDYGELILTLAQRRHVRIFTYDWRKSLALAAAQLQARIDECFAEGAHVDLVAVAEGGVVARLYIARYRNHWDRRHGRLITLGTPHTGSPIFVRALAGHLDIARWADLLDSTQNWQDFLSLVRSFPSLYQLLPFADAQTDDLYNASTYGGDAVVRQSLLDSARELQRFLPAAANPARMITVVGYNRLTTVGVDVAKFKEEMARPGAARIGVKEMGKLYSLGDGDGSTPRSAAELKTPEGRVVPAYYVDVSRYEMLASPTLLRSLDDLLTVPLDEDDTWPQLGRSLGLQLAAEAKASHLKADSKKLGEVATKEWQETRRKLEGSARKLQRASPTTSTLEVADDERLIEDVMLRHLSAGTLGGRPVVAPSVPFAPPQIEIDVVLGDISALETTPLTGDPVDAIAIGQYVGATPQDALRSVDAAVSPWFGRLAEADAGSALGTAPLIAEFCQTGVIRGDLATIFLLPDPRPDGAASQRVLAIVGMGLPGRFGPPELTLAARELCWTLGRLGKKHLATVLIGAGQNNISTAEAVRAWVRGIKFALTGVAAQGGMAIKKVTFAEFDPRKLPLIDQTLKRVQQEMKDRQRMEIAYSPLESDEYEQIQNAARLRIDAEVRKLVDAPWQQTEAGEQEPAPVRITVEYDGNAYRFGAITATASLPERKIQLDATLVGQANDELAALTDLAEQCRQGEFMARLLFPGDFRADFSGGAPVVLTVDATTARIHWEMLSLSEQQLLADGRGSSEPEKSSRQGERDLDLFLGIACGLTRQLRSPFARRPEPPPPAQRLLRVLVVADPAADARLPGAEEEGDAVADLLETFNLLTPSNNRVEVVRLIGPTEATRTTVLQHLLTRTYDVLHFAGHCVYNGDHPAASGWLFTGKELLTAQEIQRIDRVPSLVVSNACESGVTPDRSGDRSAALAPTFAETFFARGVANFVCTAWPVGDREARDFALALYADLLGLTFNPPPAQNGLRLESRYYEAGRPQPMFRALRNARKAIAEFPYDRHSWGAYQHYGNPYARLFQDTTEQGPPAQEKQ